MPTPNEWDLILGEDQQGQARMLADMLRRKQAVGDVVGLVGGKSFSGWGQGMSKGAADERAKLGEIAKFRQRQALQKRYQEAQIGQMDNTAQYQRDSLAERKRANDLTYAAKMAQIRAMAARGGGAAAGKTGVSKLPVGTQGKLQALQAQIQAIEDGLDAVEKMPQAFGFGTSKASFVPAWGPLEGVKNIWKSHETNARPNEATYYRSMVFGPAAEAIHNLWGGALTANESMRISHIPEENDEPEKIAEKLVNARNKANRELGNLIEMYGIGPGQNPAEGVTPPEDTAEYGQTDDLGTAPVPPKPPLQQPIPPMLQRPPEQMAPPGRSKADAYYRKSR